MKINNLKQSLTFVAFVALGTFSGGCNRETTVQNSQETNSYQAFKKAVDFDHPPEIQGANLNDQFNKDVYGMKRNMAMYDEQEFQVIQGQIIDPWIDSWKSKRASDFISLFKKDINVSKLPSSFTSLKKVELGHIEKYNWANSVKLIKSEEVSKNITEYLKDFDKIVHFDLSTIGVRSNSKGMRNEDKTMKIAILEIKYDLRGENLEKKRRHDRGTILATVEKVSKNEWSLINIDFSKAETLIGNKATFRNATVSSNLGKVDTYVRKEAIRRGGYAISASDIDNDGNVDLYIGTMKDGYLLQGKGETFTVGPKLGIKDDSLVKSAILSDFDNDGKKDVLLVRFDPSFKDAKRNNDVHFYKNMGNHFEKRDAIKHTNDMNFAMPAAVADYNNDGLLDVYVGYPGAQDFTFFESMRSKDAGLAPEGMYYNKNGTSFTDVTSKSLPQRGVYDSCCSLFPHSAMAVDHNLDGFMDIVVIDDAGKLSPFYVNKGDGTFVQAADDLGAEVYDYGMSVAVGDLGNNGTLDLLYTSVNFHSMERINKSMKMNWHYGSTSENFTHVGSKGLRFYKAHKMNDNKIKYIDHTEIAGLDFAGEGMAGVEFIDYNNDGNLDIYVANGLWSGSSEKKTQDISSLYSRSDRIMYGILNSLKALGEKEYYGINGEKRSQSIIMDILSSFRGDGEKAIKHKDGPSLSLAGYQRNRLFRNNGDDTFTEVGYLEGVDSIADGYIIALADLNKDGKMDIMLRNADPGTEEVKKLFNPIELFMNESNEGLNSVILTLEGTRSNKEAIGSIITAEVNGQTFTRNLIANSGTAQSERLVHFGIGKNRKLDKLTVTWPSGQVSKFQNISLGRHHIVEGAGNLISASR